MKSIIFLAAPALALARSLEENSHHPLPWHPAGPDDVRSPCPMINALANHDIWPHSGKNITKEIVVTSLSKWLNFNDTISEALFQAALTTVPQPNATSFSLADVRRHNFIEVDGSLSRDDTFFGDNHSFNQTIFNEAKAYFTGPIIDVPKASAGHAARVRNSQARNPAFDLTPELFAMSSGPSAIYMVTLGDKPSLTVRKRFVEVLFEEERLPLDVGWRRRDEVIQLEELGDLTEMILVASGMASGEAEAQAQMMKSGVVH